MSCASAGASVKQSLKLIAVVALDSNVKQLLLALGMCTHIVSATLQFSQDNSIMYYGFKAFVSLCHGSAPPDDVHHACGDLLELVIATMRGLPDDVRIQESGCEVLAILARLEQLQQAIATRGGIAVICEALKKHEAETGIQRKGCRALANMAEWEATRAAIRSEGGIPLVVNGMRYHVQHPEVGEQGCAAIANLALDEENRTEVARCDGVKACIAGLKLHQSHPGIQAYGLGALGNLAVQEDNCPWIRARSRRACDG